MSVTRILGIDPGLRLTGFGVIEKVGEKITYVASGTIKTASGKKSKVEGDPEREELPARLKIILDGLFEVIDTYQPNQVAIEKVFVNVNPQSTLLLGQARGAAISAAVIRNLSVAEYTALQVKQAVVGNGHAQKEQVQEMVKRLLKLPAAPKPDSADALACAICHAHGGQGLGLMATAGFRVRGGRLVG
ncbi:crossover junction endodeoxyribonuclease RuvC [Methylotenera oryzisoli]|uniref:Crossover junction endodeoxyribonuclease RuvC n=1 Tax=Methylotenera oryzisoli TaxID=2080758 RepID=A0A4Y9VNI9_9PROT|nr:crossover junction endodeoxyribonuclease RuvC [Methylotenera oryzisoli]TFW70078.1 crossover junction endodeoxyribonuclease RuvC [Methylotenera oryzisoli]